MLGITVPDAERRVWITVPGMVWHILPRWGFYTHGPHQAHWYCLELLQAMYGLVDAPVLHLGSAWTAEPR